MPSFPKFRFKMLLLLTTPPSSFGNSGLSVALTVSFPRVSAPLRCSSFTHCSLYGLLRRIQSTHVTRDVMTKQLSP
jgi:hypothetical protein